MDAKAVAEKRRRIRGLFSDLFALYELPTSSLVGVSRQTVELDNGEVEIDLVEEQSAFCFTVRFRHPVDHRAKLYAPIGYRSDVVEAMFREAGL